jgi:DNA polymerase
MTDEQNDFLAALYWRLQSLRLAGVKRLPKSLLAPLAAAEAVGIPGPTPVAASQPPRAARSWGDVAMQLRQQLDQATGKPKSAAQPASRASQPPAAAKGPTASATPSAARPLDPKVQEALAAVAQRVSACTRCPELVANRSRTVFADGPANAELMFIGEAPGEDEDRQGRPFVGRAGQLLNKIIVGGMKMRREDVYICNIVKCRPPANRAPSPEEAANCREYLDAQIDLVKPRVICCLGGIASHFLLDDPTPVGKLRGHWFDYRGIPVRITYHPAYLLRNYTADARQKVWDDVLKVVERLRER